MKMYHYKFKDGYYTYRSGKLSASERKLLEAEHGVIIYSTVVKI